MKALLGYRKSVQTDPTSDVKTKRVLLKFTPRQAGTQKFEVHATLEETEAVPQNNTKNISPEGCPDQTCENPVC